jgi:hypothetical protein
MNTMTKLKNINMALLKLRQPKIESLNDSSPRAVAALDCYDTVRDELMCGYEWGFCIKRAVLPVIMDDDGNGKKVPRKSEFGELYIFRLPKGFLRKLWFNRSESGFYIEGDKLLVHGNEPVKLRYLGIEEDEQKWPAPFGRCFTTMLAIELSELLQSGIEEKPVLLQEFQNYFEYAKHNESYNKPIQVVGLSDYEKSHLEGGTY